MALTLVIGNKNYSSWSLRPWIAMKVARHRLRRGRDPALRAGQQRARARVFCRPARCRRSSTATSMSGSCSRSSTISPNVSADAGLWPADAGGARARPRGRRRDACRLRARCAATAR